MSYGVRPEGFAMKPLAAIKADLEAQLRTEFGDTLILSPQSPMGQIVGTVSDALAEGWEQLLATYQTFDVDQAEGRQLDTLARLTGRNRAGRTDGDLRGAITNRGRTSLLLADLEEAVLAVPGVTFANATADEAILSAVSAPLGAIAVAAIGGQSADIAAAMWPILPGGAILHGNEYADVEVNGRCRSLSILRPVDVPVGVAVTVRVHRSRSGCAPPTASDIADVIAGGWLGERLNGRDVTPHAVRRFVEAVFPQIEVVAVTAFRSDAVEAARIGGTTPGIQFEEIASIAREDVQVTFA